MSSPKTSAPVQNPTTTQDPIWSGDAAADEAARKKKEQFKDATSSSSSILTSGAGVLDDENIKKNLLGGASPNKSTSLG